MLCKKARKLGYFLTMEDGARSALRELNLASRKAEEAGQSVFLSQFTFTFCVSFSLVAEKEKS